MSVEQPDRRHSARFIGAPLCLRCSSRSSLTRRRRRRWSSWGSSRPLRGCPSELRTARQRQTSHQPTSCGVSGCLMSSPAAWLVRGGGQWSGDGRLSVRLLDGSPGGQAQAARGSGVRFVQSYYPTFRRVAEGRPAEASASPSKALSSVSTLAQPATLSRSRPHRGPPLLSCPRGRSTPRRQPTLHP
jgi:hypothetical protein